MSETIGIHAHEEIEEFATGLLDAAAAVGDPVVIEVLDAGLIVAIPESLFAPGALRKVQTAVLQAINDKRSAAAPGTGPSYPAPSNQAAARPAAAPNLASNAPSYRQSPHVPPKNRP